jgi:hypothetical protein
LQGDIPQDVKDLIDQHAAELGVASGMPGSQFAQYRGLRDLGLTSLARSDAATNALLPIFARPTPMIMPNTGPPTTPQGFVPGGSRPPEVPATVLSPGGPTGRNVGDDLARYLGGNKAGGSDINAILANLGGTFGPGRGYSPMGSGTMPTYGANPMNAGALDTGMGNFWAGAANPGTSDLADMGVVDPLFGQPDYFALANEGTPDEYFQ